MQVSQAVSFASCHSDLIHDTVYDYYGSALATCSSDQRLAVHEKTETGWSLVDVWKGHDASILRLAWSHPEYGRLLVSCGMDRTVRVWEENAGGNGRRWAERARLVDACGPVQDVAFAPSHLGLKIAACSSEGLIRIYEALDTVNPSLWTLMDDFEITSMAKDTPSLDAHYSLSWCPNKFFPTSIAATCGKEYQARIYRVDGHNKWTPLETLNGHADLVTCIAWAPNLGRSYELIATGCRDGHVRIFRLKDTGEKVKTGKYRVDCIGDFGDHEAPVWSLNWNVTGTILSSSGDDGKIRLWKASFLEEWRCMTVVSAEQSHHVSETINR